MLFTLDFLKKYFPQYDGMLEASKQINHVGTDSRSEKANSLFVPIVGEKFDGHAFLAQAIENGAVAALWQKSVPKPVDIREDFVFFYTEDTLEGLQYLASAYREEVNPTVIGITGSNGKTTTKDLLHSVLKRTYITYATRGNLNNHIGVPLTILEMTPDTEMLILEMGMNHFHEIELLSKLAKPNYAIITNIGESHIEYLGSREGIAQAKLEITHGLSKRGSLVIDADEPLLTEKQYEMNVIRCGVSETANLLLSEMAVDTKKTTFVVNTDAHFSVPLLGAHHAKNASYAIAIARKFQMTDQTIQQGLDSVLHSAMRFEQVYGRNGVLLINDAYNASVTSMVAAIDVIQTLQGFKEKILVLGDILELGLDALDMHQSIANAISEEIDYVYTYGQFAKEITDTLHKKKTTTKAVHFSDKAQLKTVLDNHLHDKAVILFKASRMMKLEQLVESCK